ncbi:MAG: hypothetical protein ACRC4W_04220 [Treponemataceae bacterium]
MIFFKKIVFILFFISIYSVTFSQDISGLKNSEQKKIIAARTAVEKAMALFTEIQEDLFDKQLVAEEFVELLDQTPDDKELKKLFAKAEKDLVKAEKEMLKAQATLEKEQQKLDSLYLQLGTDEIVVDTVVEAPTSAEGVSKKTKANLEASRLRVLQSQNNLDDAEEALTNAQLELESARQNILNNPISSDFKKAIVAAEKAIADATKMVATAEKALEKDIKNRDSVYKKSGLSEAAINALLGDASSGADIGETVVKIDPKTKNAIQVSTTRIAEKQADLNSLKEMLSNTQLELESVQQSLSENPEDKELKKIVSSVEKDIKKIQKDISKTEAALRREQENLNEIYKKVGLHNLVVEPQIEPTLNFSEKHKIRLLKVKDQADNKMLTIQEKKEEQQIFLDAVQRILDDLLPILREKQQEFDEATSVKTASKVLKENEKAAKKNAPIILKIEKLQEQLDLINEEAGFDDEILAERESIVQEIAENQSKSDELQAQIKELDEALANLLGEDTAEESEEDAEEDIVSDEKVKAEAESILDEKSTLEYELDEIEALINELKSNMVADAAIIKKAEKSFLKRQTETTKLQSKIAELESKLSPIEELDPDMEILEYAQIIKRVSEAKKELKAIEKETRPVEKELAKGLYKLDRILEKEADLQMKSKYLVDVTTPSLKREDTYNSRKFLGEGYALLNSNFAITDITDITFLLMNFRQDIFGESSDLKFKYKIGLDLYANISSPVYEGNFSFEQKNTGLFILQWGANKTINFELREYWFQFSPSIIDILIGKKRLRYGTAEIYSPLDIINPKYIDSKITSTEEDLRMGSLMFNLTVNYPNNLGHFQVFFMPMPSVDIYGKYFTKRVAENSLSYKFFEGGLRTLFNIGKTQLSVSAFSIIDRSPNDIFGFYLSPEGDIEDPIYGRGRRYVGGIDLFAPVNEVFHINFECAFIMTDDMFLDLNASRSRYSPKVHSSYIECALEFKFTIPGSNPFFIHIFYSPKLILNTKIIGFFTPWPFDNLAGIKLTGKAINTHKVQGVFEPELQFLMSIPSMQWEGNLSFGLRFSPQWQLKLGARVLGTFANPASTYRRYGRFYVAGGKTLFDDASKAFVELKFHW